MLPYVVSLSLQFIINYAVYQTILFSTDSTHRLALFQSEKARNNERGNKILQLLPCQLEMDFSHQSCLIEG